MNVGLVFGIIFAAIVIGLLMFFGFKYINEVVDLSCQSQMGQQIVNLEKAVDSTMTLSRGGSQKYNFLFPSCLERVCFVDPDNPGVDNPEGGWESTEFMIDLVSRYKYNLIFIEPNGGFEGHVIDKVKPYVNFCLTSAKEVTLLNTGRTVEISLPEFR